MNNKYYNMNNKRCIRENGGHGSNPIIVRKLRAMRTIDELLRTPSPEIAERAKEAVEDLANTAFELAYPRTNESRNRSVIRMTESDLHRMVKESVNKILREHNFDLDTKQGQMDYDWDYLDNYKQKYDNPYEIITTPTHPWDYENRNVYDDKGRMGMNALGANGSTMKKIGRNYKGTMNTYKTKM